MPEHYFDFRSDTLTQPTPEMRAAMAAAPVGDDVYGEDPTVNRLEQEAAKRMGKEAGLFVSSGTQGNLIAVLAHCARGEEAIMGREGHTFKHEAGGISVLGGVVMNTLPNQPDGTLDLEAVAAEIHDGSDPHSPVTRLVILENTHNGCGGVPLSLDYTKATAELAQKQGLKLHLDGARLFNAAVALGLPASSLAGPADSVTFCLSKGLCAPVGSVLCGTQEFIIKGRRLRKILGGGMRQAGVLAAAGLVALDSMVERLAEDHALAAELADQLENIPGIVIEKGGPKTNMVFIRLADEVALSGVEFLARVKAAGVLFSPRTERSFRLVTHHDVDRQAVAACAKAIREALS